MIGHSSTVMSGRWPGVVLCDESVVMLDAAENGKGDDPSPSWRRHAQFRIRVRDSMDRLRGARPIVIANVLSNDTPDVIDGEEDEVIQGFLPQRSIEPLDVR